MNATVNIICYRQKILKNGEHPLMIRVAKGGKRKLKSLGIMSIGIRVKIFQHFCNFFVTYSYKRIISKDFYLCREI